MDYELEYEFNMRELKACASISDVLSCPFRQGCNLNDKCRPCGCSEAEPDIDPPGTTPLQSLCSDDATCRGRRSVIFIEKPDGTINLYEHDCGPEDAPQSFIPPGDYDPAADRVYITCLP
jgi:hypothetical protein